MAILSSTHGSAGDYARTLDYLANRVNYERWRHLPYSQQTLKLDRMRQLLRELGNPETGLPIVHVAGTKGKGSVSAMVSAVLTAAGRRVGLYTSPHLHRVEERFQLDGNPCPPEQLVALVDRLRPAVERLDQQGRTVDPDDTGPTFFEITTALALMYFSEVHADAVVLEVGMGGRFDSTNVCQPKVAVITSISLDHTRQLGETEELIAREKAGIIKPGIPVVSGVVSPGPREVIRDVCRSQGAPLRELGEDFDFRYRPPHDLQAAPGLGSVDFIDRTATPPKEVTHIPLALPGLHQGRNAAVALATLGELECATGRRIGEEPVRRGLSELRWPARVEVVGRHPVQIVDAAHNVASIGALVETLETCFCVARRRLLFAVSEDKDVPGMLELLLPRFGEIILTRFTSSPRAIPPERLQQLARAISDRPLLVDPEPIHAWNTLVEHAAPDELLCVTGSFFIASEIRQHVLGKTHEKDGSP